VFDWKKPVLGSVTVGAYFPSAMATSVFGPSSSAVASFCEGHALDLLDRVQFADFDADLVGQIRIADAEPALRFSDDIRYQVFKRDAHGDKVMGKDER